MKRTTALYSLATAVTVLLAGCSGASQSPLSPSPLASTGLAADADAPTLKASPPTLVSPINDATTANNRPTFTFTKAETQFPAPLTYRVQVMDESGTVLVQGTVPGGSGNQTAYRIPADLPLGKKLRWKVRAELEGAASAYSATGSFRTPAVSTFDGGGPVIDDGTVGPRRSIGLQEAFGIIVRIHNERHFNLGSGSSRQSRVDFLWAAVAAIHYGHPRFNPGGGDPNWCVKDAGGGRPPSDDVLVKCGSREAWDLVAGAGGNGYRFHTDYLGRLPGGQNVYPPPRSYLGRLGN